MMEQRKQEMLRTPAPVPIAATLKFSTLRPGMIVVYRLRENQFPLHPEKEWRARIKQTEMLTNALEVELLTEGYEEYEEWIYLHQLVRVEDAPPARP